MLLYYKISISTIPIHHISYIIPQDFKNDITNSARNALLGRFYDLVIHIPMV